MEFENFINILNFPKKLIIFYLGAKKYFQIGNNSHYEYIWSIDFRFKFASEYNFKEYFDAARNPMHIDSKIFKLLLK